ncbi:MAG TPA: hypothetical protein VKA84_01270 [Gemmatimonadaceae bacterium]|nr:hypothetical protein [Gemmatimonadaceae bacterium]
MSDAAIFVLVFGGLFVLRFIAATLVFWWILPEGDRCPNCDAVTLRVQATGFERLMPRMRSSWCHECGWEGMLRPGPLTPPPGGGPPGPPGPPPGMKPQRRERRDVRRNG